MQEAEMWLEIDVIVAALSRCTSGGTRGRSFDHRQHRRLGHPQLGILYDFLPASTKCKSAPRVGIECDDGCCGLSRHIPRLLFERGCDMVRARRPVRSHARASVARKCLALSLNAIVFNVPAEWTMY